MANRERIQQALVGMAYSVYQGSEAIRNADSNFAAVVFLGSDIGLEEACKTLNHWKNSGRKMIFFFSDAAMRVLDTERLIKRYRPSEVINSQSGLDYKGILSKIHDVFIPNLTQNTAAKLAVGIQDDLITTFLWQSLLVDKPVYAMAEGISNAWFGLERNPAMVRTMQGHLEKLAEYGMVFGMPRIPAKEDQQNNQQNTINEKTANGCKTIDDPISMKVITERHIKALERGSRIWVRKGVKITPLAKEAARIRRIELMETEEGNMR